MYGFWTRAISWSFQRHRRKVQARVNTWTLEWYNNLIIALYKFADDRILNNADIRTSGPRIIQLHRREVQIAYRSNTTASMLVQQQCQQKYAEL